MDKLKMATKNLADENYKKLAALFPNAVTETITGYDESGKAIIERAVDADVLRQEISSTVVEGRDERYQFTWPDKKKTMVLSNMAIEKTLRPSKNESINFDNTENIFIEGDNLDVLKLLQEAYLEKVKMIYIDPPYNTGSDLIYEDDFSEDNAKYIANSGQIDEEGNRLFKNLDSNGRFHSDWLNMIYSRLRLSKNLLTDDGVIYISIDDNEIGNLRKICDEVFGVNNFMACIVWQKKTSSDARMDISAAHDYILLYAKNRQSNKYLLNALSYEEERLLNYKNPDNDPRGVWASVDITGQTGRAPKSQFYEITTPSGKKYLPPDGRCWAMAERTFLELVSDGRIWFGESGDNRPRQKKFLSESDGQRPWTWWNNKFASYNQASNKELMQIFDGKVVFDNPKPTQLIGKMLELSTSKDSNDIVLDFFSGSCSTAASVLYANAKDGGNRKFICVQIPQNLADTGNDFKANNIALQMGFSTICDIGKERIRRTIKNISDDKNVKKSDYGFRVLKCDSSNMKDIYYNPGDVQQSFFASYNDNIKEDRTPEDLLFQVMLDLGVLLSSKIEVIEIAGKKVFKVADGFLIACFDSAVSDETVKEVAMMKPYYAVFRDSCMENDSVATNFEQIFMTYSPDTVRKVL